MHPDDLVRLKIAIEFGVEPDGETMPAAIHNIDSQPRLLVSRFTDDVAWFFRHDVPAATRARLKDVGPERMMDDESAVRAILAVDAPVEHIWRVRWYTMTRVPHPSEFRDAVLHDGRHVILRDGRVVAQAWTVSENDRAAEVEVETHVEYRRRGYARQVVAAWASEVLAQGRVAYYSHAIENAASREVGRSLGLTHLSDEVEYR